MRAKRARLRTSTPALRLRPSSTTTGSAGKTISPPTGRAAEQAIAANPTIVPGVRTNRAFPRRAVCYLASEAGIRQFLDIGTGLPPANNTHQVAQAVAAILQLIPDDPNPHRILERLMDGLPAGSYLVITHPAGDVLPDAMAETQRRLNERQRAVTTFRPRPDVCRFF